MLRTGLGHDEHLTHIVSRHKPRVVLGTGELKAEKHREDTRDNGVIFTILVFKAQPKVLLIK